MPVIACDESGYEGEHLIGGVTPVFAHAGTDLDPAAAQEIVAELRERIRSPAVEYKANHLLRAKHRGALVWLLDTLAGRATVHLVDKAFLLRTVLDGIAPGARDEASLRAAEAMLRARYRATEPADRPAFPPLDPLPRAIGATVAAWSGDGPVALVHDRQTTLSPSRIAALLAAHPALTGVTLVASRDDARVQVADFIAGVAYRIAADALAGEGEPELLRLLRPYVDPGSMWSDPASAAQLGVAPAVTGKPLSGRISP